MDKKIIMSLETIMGDRFGKYSKYIIQDRALPDVRDGLKPVQRRILYSMYKEGNFYSKPYRKSAKTVGNVIGNYHQSLKTLILYLYLNLLVIQQQLLIDELKYNALLLPDRYQ